QELSYAKSIIPALADEKSCLIVTSRPFPGDLNVPIQSSRIDCVFLENFSSRECQEYVRQWFTADEFGRTGQPLIDWMATNAECAAEFLAIPHLLALACHVWETNSPQAHGPREPIVRFLFDKVTNQLLESGYDRMREI